MLSKSKIQLIICCCSSPQLIFWGSPSIYMHVVRWQMHSSGWEDCKSVAGIYCSATQAATYHLWRIYLHLWRECQYYAKSLWLKMGVTKWQTLLNTLTDFLRTVFHLSSWNSATCAYCKFCASLDGYSISFSISELGTLHVSQPFS